MRKQRSLKLHATKPPHWSILLLLLLPVVPALLSAWWHPSGPSWDRMALAEGEVNLVMVEGWPGPVLWVDARNAEAFARGRIPGAVNLYPGNFEEQAGAFLEVWEPDMPVVIYCDSLECGASAELADKLRLEWGLEDIYVLKGGWASWQKANP